MSCYSPCFLLEHHLQIRLFVLRTLLQSNIRKKSVETPIVQNRICSFSVVFNLEDVTEQFHSNKDIDVYVILEH